MNKTFLTFALILFSNSIWSSEIDCKKLVNNQIDLINSSSQLITKLTSKNERDISMYEVTLLQKSLTLRYSNLNQLIQSYENKKTCNDALLSDAIGIYDLTTLDKTAIKNTTLRRMILSFMRYPKYNLTNLRDLFTKYTSYQLIKDTEIEIKRRNYKLPTEIIINRSDYHNGGLESFSDFKSARSGNLISGLAKTWGFVSDKTIWRDGHLNNNKDAKDLILSKLRPLDFIYETRKFTLSNYTIPGNWGHVAVYLGTKEELIAAGIWEKDFIEPYKTMIESGKNIIEIRKEGIRFQSIDTFLNLDNIAVTRINNLTSNETEIYQNLFSQADKKYDFTFNAHSEDKITCAELIGFSFGDINFPTVESFGKIMLRPDDLAYLTVKSPEISSMVLYLTGNEDKTFTNHELSDWKKLYQERLNKESI